MKKRRTKLTADLGEPELRFSRFGALKEVVEAFAVNSASSAIPDSTMEKEGGTLEKGTLVKVKWPRVNSNNMYDAQIIGTNDKGGKVEVEFRDGRKQTAHVSTAQIAIVLSADL